MMQRKIESFVEEPWGCATVYSVGPQKTDDTAVVATESQVIQAVSMLQVADDMEESLSIHSKTNGHDSPKKCLSYFVSSMFATIMEDALTKIRILMECNSELRIIKTISDMQTLRALKFNIKQKDTDTDEMDKIDPNNLECEEYKISKLDADRNFIGQTLIATYIDLCVTRNFVVLEKAIKNIIGLYEYRVSLSEEETRRKNIRRELTKQLRQQRNHIKAATYDSNVIMERLKAQVEDSVLFTNCQNRYIDKWQEARTEQHIQTINETEVISTEVVEYYKRRADHEQRVHAEAELLINIIINETLESIEEWMEKYDKDMELVDLKIRGKRNNYQNMRDKRIAFETTFEEHDNIMKEWIAFKEFREQQRLYREKMTKSAIMVQAWWRGLLVRRKLGPFRVGKRGRRRRK